MRNIIVISALFGLFVINSAQAQQEQPFSGDRVATVDEKRVSRG